MPYAPIKRGDVVLVVETSKATFEVESDLDGHLGPLLFTLNDRVSAGELICEVFADPVPESQREAADPRAGSGDGPRLTRKAASLAEELGVDVSALPSGRFLTERDIAAYAEAAAPASLDEAIARRITDSSLVIFGAGGLGKSIIDLARADERLEPLCVVDDDPLASPDVLGLPLAGTRSVLAQLRERGAALAANGVGAIGKISVRVAIFELLSESGFVLPPLVERSAYVAASARLARGVQVFANAAVCSDVELGDDVIVNTGAVVSHDCVIGAHAHLAPGATLAGHVEVGERTLVGMGVTTAVGVRIGAEAIVGNGCVVNVDVPDGTIVAAGTVWPKP